LNSKIRKSDPRLRGLEGPAGTVLGAAASTEPTPELLEAVPTALDVFNSLSV